MVQTNNYKVQSLQFIYYELPVSVTVNLRGCLSLYVSPAMNWRPIQGVPHPRPLTLKLAQ